MRLHIMKQLKATIGSVFVKKKTFIFLLCWVCDTIYLPSSRHHGDRTVGKQRGSPPGGDLIICKLDRLANFLAGSWQTSVTVTGKK